MSLFYYCQHFQQQAEGQDAKTSTKKLFVGGIKDDMTEDMLREEFSKYGNVQSIKIIQGKGFCFIEFDDHDAVDWCNCKSTSCILLVPVMDFCIIFLI